MKAKRPTPTCRFLLWALGMGGLVAAKAIQAAEVPPGVELAALQHLVINNGTEITSLDPHKHTGGRPEINIMCNVLEGLVNLDREGQVVPGVAVRWESQDQKKWLFHLRHDARWSNGDPVTAHDFVYSWRRLADPKTAAPYPDYLIDIKLLNSEAVIAGHQSPDTLGIHAIDDYTLQLSLSQPVPYLVAMLTSQLFYPVHQSSIEQWGDQWTSPTHWVGNGAYHLQQWIVNEKVVLTRSPTYWDNQRTMIEQVTYLPIELANTEFRRYQANEIDITSTSIPAEVIQKLRREQSDELYSIPSLSINCYQFNTHQPPFNDVRVRQALALTVDRTVIVEQILARGDRVAYTFTPPGMGGFVAQAPAWVNWSQKKRQREAKRLLTEAGYNKQNPLRFTLLYSTSDLSKQLALTVSAVWQKTLAAQITLLHQEWKVFLENCDLGHYQIASSGWFASYNEPSARFKLLLSYKDRHHAFYQSPVFDRWIAKAQLAKDEAERFRYYQQAETQLAQDVPIIPLFFPVNNRLVKPYVGGMSKHNPINFIAVKNLYIVKKQTAEIR